MWIADSLPLVVHLWRNQGHQCQIYLPVLVLLMITLVNRTASVWNTRHWIRGCEGGATDDIRHFAIVAFHYRYDYDYLL